MILTVGYMSDEGHFGGNILFISYLACEVSVVSMKQRCEIENYKPAKSVERNR